MGISQSRVSRLETAKFRVDLAVVRQWLDATDADEQTRTRVLALAEEAVTEIAEYRSIFRGSLLDASGWPAVTVQVIPADAPMRQAPMCAFILTEFRDPGESTIAAVELPAVELTFSGADDLTAFETTWQHMLDAALDPQQSHKLITTLLRK